MTDWLLDTLVTTGALIALVLVIRKPVARHFGPGVAYALWALPLIRLFLPPLELPGELAPQPDFVLMPAAAGDAPAGEFLLASATTGTVQAEPALALGTILLVLWLGGAIAYLAMRANGYVAMRRKLLEDARHVASSGKVRIVESPEAYAPVAFGVFDKVVALPVGFLAEADTDESDLAIAHELEHHRGNDLAANIAMQPLLALHWFNPLAWAAWRAMRSDQEAACDARVVAQFDGEEVRETYGRLIASFAGAPRHSLAAPMAGPLLGDKPIITRLKSLATGDVSPRRRAFGRTLLAGSALALPLTATVTYAAIESPVAPEAPVAPVAPAAPGVAPVAPLAPDAPRVEKIRHEVVERVVDVRQSEENSPWDFFDRFAEPRAERIAHLDRAEEARIERDVERRAERAEREAERAERAVERRVERELARAEREAGQAEREAERAEREAERAGREAEQAARRAVAAAPHVQRWTSRDGKVQKIRIEHRDRNGNATFSQAMVIDASCEAGSANDHRQVSGDASYVKICTGIPRKLVANALAQARAAIEADTSMCEETKAEILRDMDAEISAAKAELDIT
ncbi:hypothetical protein GCM10011371_02220 [Novosphingobium marinum]|uniref:Beta-lactamase regulating signal transducer with metallopeptidase domain n=1 Tax=Novosphingobium marinum TaxID=1514948 RepID=A0A7Y9XST6_9SPHN|nr:M56 family metallopeptidase [Novosphingobium marinum]NYH93914.1 beta-lactamase regulating signal transducer with metallopeptidase domain [Novosphingobium marinum]GGC18240.1 hypothetical protein GCM10011371_02220 [Novosphingobium marinum]